jgi:hypothetical protein
VQIFNDASEDEDDGEDYDGPLPSADPKSRKDKSLGVLSEK